MYLNSWRPKTRLQYSVYLRKWFTLCVLKGWDVHKPQLNEAIFFLTNLFDKGMSHSSINSARCMLSNVIHKFEGFDFGKHPIVIRVMKGIYNRRPQMSRYGSTWDVDLVLDFLRELSPLRKLTLRELTAKCVVLLMLVSAQRVQTLTTLRVKDMLVSKEKTTIVFRLSQVLKHSRKGSLGTIVLNAFPQDSRLCIVKTILMYLDKTSDIRDKDTDSLFITTTPPFKGASSTTIARWVKETLANSGVDLTMFSAHSVRGATTSKMYDLQIPVNDIMQKAMWKSENTFTKFYKKSILPKDISSQVLSSFLNRKK